MFHTFRFPGCTAPSYIYIHFLFDYYVFIYVLHIYIYICRFAPLKKFQNGVPNPYTARHWHQNQVKRFPCHRSLILHIVRSFSRSIESMSLIWFSKSHRMKSTSFKCHICGLKNLTIFSLFFRTAVKLRYQYVNKTNA